MNHQIKTFKDLDTWRIACELTEAIYNFTSDFPKSEKYGLVDQMRRAAISIPSNIAEGYGRRSKAELIRYCRISYGSLCELETQLSLAKKMKISNHGDTHQIDQLLNRTQMLLNRLIASLIRRSS